MSELLDAKALKARLKRIVFRIEGKDEEGRTRYGTGFFISRGGMALTAYHNLPAEVRRRRGGPVTAYFGNEQIELQWLPSSEEDAGWQKSLDVAVLHGPPGKVREADLVPCMYLPMTARRTERAGYWSARPVAVVGFTLDRGFALASPVMGTVSADEPIQDPIISGTGVVAEEALAFGADFQRRLVRLGGVSGGPVYDRNLNAIVAVEFALSEDPACVYARELHHLARHWPGFSTIAPEIRNWKPGEHRREVRRWLRAAHTAIAALAVTITIAVWVALRTFWPTIEALPFPAPPADLVLAYSIERQAADRLETLTLSRENFFRASDRVRFRLSSPQSGHLYLLNETGGGGYTILFPSPSTNQGSSHLGSNAFLRLPERSWLEMDSQKGKEKFWLIYSMIRLEQLERLQRFANEVDLGAVPAPEDERLRGFFRLHRESMARARLDESGRTALLFARGWLLVHLLEL